MQQVHEVERALAEQMGALLMDVVKLKTLLAGAEARNKDLLEQLARQTPAVPAGIVSSDGAPGNRKRKV